MNKSLILAIAKLLPEYLYADPVFYKPPVNHIVTGFVLNKSPHEIFAHGGAFPLYEPSTERRGIHLTFTTAYDISHATNVSEIAKEFSQCIRDHEDEVKQLESVSVFSKNYPPRLPLDDRDITRRRMHVLNMIMLNKEEEALHHISLLLKSKYIVNDDRLKELHKLPEIYEILQAGGSVARDRLTEWEASNRLRYGIL